MVCQISQIRRCGNAERALALHNVGSCLGELLRQTLEGLSRYHSQRAIFGSPGDNAIMTLRFSSYRSTGWNTAGERSASGWGPRKTRVTRGRATAGRSYIWGMHCGP